MRNGTGMENQTTSKLASIDALRGYAVILVIASHSFPTIHEIPWTLKRFTNLGFYGVQLFFIVSCVTLSRSWRERETTARPSVASFMSRRLFRIVPAYFLAAVLYAWLMPEAGPSVLRIATFVTFTSGWSPSQMPTVANAWAGVPGGWSIEAEFAFYALFPLLMLTLRGFWPAVLALVASLPIAWGINAAGWAAYEPLYGAQATDQFLYYWLPNQLPVFLCGLVLFNILTRLDAGGAWEAVGTRLARHSVALLAGSLLGFAALGVAPWPRLPEPSHLFVPSHLLAAVAFCGCTIALVLRPLPLLVNRLIVLIGEASFSAYLLHFAVLDLIKRLLPIALSDATGIAAILASTLLFALVLALTCPLSCLAYRFIENPGNRLGRRVIASQWHHNVTA